MIVFPEIMQKCNDVNNTNFAIKLAKMQKP